MVNGVHADAALSWRRVTFWWWAAAGLAVWPFLSGPQDLRPASRRMVAITCEPPETPHPAWRYALGDVAGDLGGMLYLAAPVLLLMLAPALHRYAAGRPRAHLRAARWTFVPLVLAGPLLHLGEVLTPWLCPGRQEPDPLDALLRWAISAPVAVLIAGAAAARLRPGSGPDRPGIGPESARSPERAAGKARARRGR